MRYSILGFKQEELIKYDLDMSDVLLLDYIQNALSQPSMIKTFQDGQPYVWLNHDKILEDLPILNIKKRMLSNKLSKLTECGLIKSINRANDRGKGSKVYYTITEKVEDMQYDKESTTSKKLHVVERPQVKNYTSNNKLNNNDNKLSKESSIKNTTLESGYSNNFLNNSYRKNTKKPNAYTNCILLINEFTDNEYLRELLIKFLKIFEESQKLNGYSLYPNRFKGCLNKLKNITTDSSEQIEIVKYVTDNGYAGFFKLNKNQSNKSMKTVNGKFQDNIEPDRRDTTGKEFEEVNEGF